MKNQSYVGHHPWVATSACHILNPPRKFHFADAIRWTKYAAKGIAALVLGMLACVALYECAYVIWAWVACE